VIVIGYTLCSKTSNFLTYSLGTAKAVRFVEIAIET